MGWNMSEVQQAFTPSVEQSTNFKEYFIKYDALKNVSSELVVSLLRKYKCNAGCKMCYLKDTWLSNNVYDAKYAPSPLTQDVEDQILKLFGSFSIITTMDDLLLLKTKYPDLYQFYVRNGPKMSSTAMSDTAFIQQFPLIMSEIHFESIYEVSFSDVFLNKKGGTLVGDIIIKLKALHQRSPIKKIKVIVLTDDGESSDAVGMLVDWAHSKSISVGVHDDITQNKNTRVSLKHADYQELNFYSQDSLPMQALSEVVHLQYTDLYLTMVDCTSEQDPPFYNIITDGLDRMDVFLSKMLQAKIKTYERYVDSMDSACENKLRDYYKYVTSSVVAHEPHSFNFIPRLFLPNWTEMYKTIASQGFFVETPYGLYNPNRFMRRAMVPLFEFTAAPKMKLHHIPIKCARVKRK